MRTAAWVKNIGLALACCAGTAIADAQQLTEKLITRDKGDSLMLKAFRSAFDTNGHYYFETLMKGKGERFVIQTDRQIYPPVQWSNSTALAPYKALISDAFFSDTTRKNGLYVKNKTGTTVYGPLPGRIREVLEFGKDHIAIELCTGKKSSFYIDGQLINTADTLKQQWQCSFSTNGQVIYSFFREGMYLLRLNHHGLDSSVTPFSDMAVNDNGFYTYVKTEDGKTTLVTPARQFPMPAAAYNELWDDNSYYSWGCKNGDCAILVNGQMYAHIPEPRVTTEDEATGANTVKGDLQVSIKPIGKDHFIFTHNREGNNTITVNESGKESVQYFSFNSEIAVDKSGKYAFYAVRSDTVHQFDRVYKFVNGVEQPIKPLNRKTINRLIPLQLAPDGTNTYYFQSRDSIYLFHNDSALRNPVSSKRFAVWDYSILPQSDPDGLHYFQGINIEGETFLLYDKTISRPLPLAFLDYDRFAPPQKGSIVAGTYNENGFFIIEYISKGKYLLVINNAVYKELTGIDYIFSDQSYFYNRNLVFYGIKGNAFYQYHFTY